MYDYENSLSWSKELISNLAICFITKNDDNQISITAPLVLTATSSG